MYTQFILGLVKIKGKDIDEGKRFLTDSKENLEKASKDLHKQIGYIIKHLI